MTRENPWAEKNRLKKVHAVRDYIDGHACSAGLNPYDPAIAQAIVDQLLAAPDARWTDLESKEKANVKKLSPDSRAALIAIYRARTGQQEKAAAVAAVPGVKLCATCGERPAEDGDSQCGPCWNKVCDETSMGPLRGALGDFGP